MRRTTERWPKGKEHRSGESTAQTQESTYKVNQSNPPRRPDIGDAHDMLKAFRSHRGLLG